MSKRRLVITAVLAGTSQSEVARTYGVSQGWISRLMARYRAEGEEAFEPRSRAPKTRPRLTPDVTVQLVLRLRKQLDEAGLDAGADTIGWHLQHHHQITLARATINRILVRAGQVSPDHRSGPSPPTSGSKPSSRTRPGSPTSPTTGSPIPTAPTAPTARSSPGWTTTPATPCMSRPTPG
jgi:transposase